MKLLMDRRKSVVLLTLVIAAGVLLYSPTHAQGISRNSNATNEEEQRATIKELNNNLATLTDQVKEIRRDQLNYKIEKDLLKETYSSNMAAVNTIITIVLGTFTILGFLGVRSIYRLREDFSKELQTFDKITSEARNRLKEIEIQQRQAESKIENLEQTNELQNQRLGVVETRELASNAYERKDFGRSIELLDQVLEIRPDDEDALNEKALNLFKLTHFEEASQVLEAALKINPDNSTAITNYIESLFLVGKQDEFSVALKTYRYEITKTKFLDWYFFALEIYLANNTEDIVQHAKELFEELPDDNEPEIFLDWQFDDFRRATKQEHSSELRNILLVGSDVLSGEISTNEGKERLDLLLTGTKDTDT